MGRPRTDPLILAEIPCSTCGARRDCKGARCLKCLAKSKRDYRALDPERHRRYLREWAVKNPDKIKASSRKNYLNHKDRFIREAYEWGRKNPKKRSKIMSFQNAKRRSRQMANGGNGFTKTDWNELFEKCGGLCVYCRAEKATSIDHFTPLTKGGENCRSNIFPCCKYCNPKKGNREPMQWVIKHFGQERLDWIQSIRLLRYTPDMVKSGHALKQIEIALKGALL